MINKLNFRQSLVKYAVGTLPTLSLPEVGILALGEGYDTPMLRILASLGKNDNSFEIERYFNKAIKELNIKLPPKREACIMYAFIISDYIVKDDLDVIDGVSDIMTNAINNYDFCSETKKYVYDSIFFENVYGCYDDYDDLMAEFVDSPENISKEGSITEVKSLLYQALITWREQIKSNIEMTFVA